MVSLALADSGHWEEGGGLEPGWCGLSVSSCVPSRWYLLSRPLGFFFRMIAYDCYEYEAFALPLRFKKQLSPTHDFLVSEDTQRNICVQHISCTVSCGRQVLLTGHGALTCEQKQVKQFFVLDKFVFACHCFIYCVDMSLFSLTGFYLFVQDMRHFCVHSKW